MSGRCAAALELYEKVQAERWEEIEPGKSLASGFGDADPEAILAWNRRMAELVAMNHLQELIDSGVPAAKARLDHPLTKVQKEWLEGRLKQGDYSRRMRLHYYTGMALGGAEGEKEIAAAFQSLSSAILEAAPRSSEENREARIRRDQVEVKLPLRVNWGGGFLQVILRKDVEKKNLQERLKSVFSDTEINVWECTLI